MLHNSLGLLFLFSTYALNTVEAAPSAVTSTAISYSPEWSPSQLSEIPDAKFLIVPGTTLDTDTTIIPTRYECSHVKGTFAIDGADDKKLILTLSTTWSLGDKPKCDVNWGDRSNEEVAFDSTTMIDVNHTYADYGAYVPKFVCSDEGGNVSNCPAQNDSCVGSFEFFDVIFRDINTPLKCFVNDRNQFDSFPYVRELCSSQHPVINWRLNKIKGSSIEPFTNFAQPNTTSLAFDPYDIEPGLYFLSLELTFKHFNSLSWNADYMLVYVILPELVATISGGTILTIPHGTTFTVDASRSNDPAARLESISGEQLIANWSFVNYAAGPSEIQRNVFTKLFPTMGLPTGSKIYVIQTGDEYLLSVNSSYFPVNSWCLVMFSIKRGDRASSVIQWLNLVSNAVPITISCIKNCHAGREKKILDEEIQFDAVIPQELQGVTGVTYSWTILNLNLVNKFVEAKVAPEFIPTGRTSRSIGIKKGALTPGQHYTIKVQVTVPGYAAGSASIVGTVNYVPYAGTCILNRDTEFDEEMPMPEQSSITSVPKSHPVISPKKNVMSPTPVSQSQKETIISTSKSNPNLETVKAPVNASAEFIDMSTDDVKAFIDNQQNKNTLRKTVGDMLKVQKFLLQRGESREVFHIPHDELDPLLANFILSVRKADGSDYEPTSLRGILSSLDRKLKRHQYPYTVMASTRSAFSLTRDALKAKQRQLKKEGKGNKLYKSQAIEDNEIDALYDKGVLGCSTPQSLLNTMWFNNTIHFGPGGIEEPYSMRWGDIELHETSDGVEYLERNERQTKTRTWEDTTDVRKVPPKMFATGDDRCPVAAYKLYALKRPAAMNDPDSPFYEATRTVPIRDLDHDPWFINQRVGKKKLSKVAGSLNIAKRLTNHSARKHLVQKLRDSNVPPTEIMQISGHKSISSVLKYSSMSENTHKNCSDILSKTKRKPAIV